MRSSMGSSAIRPRLSPLNMPDSASSAASSAACSHVGSRDRFSSTTTRRPSAPAWRCHGCPGDHSPDTTAPVTMPPGPGVA
ncbi:hypothetical protein Y1Q_0004390 [Alligator mississippiensis]|uniref:Uncharacterized protein n=1 Tax=Alligator mississippiensis TaxID=8496 RepID=A0A151NV29_ALLMI|nr:hypothetical protein Y1Q_0004390 [Alligator mississippiensis]